MKESIIGYVTALSNTYQGKLKRIPQNTEANMTIKNFISDLDDLLIYIEDIPERTEPVTIVLGGKKNE